MWTSPAGRSSGWRWPARSCGRFPLVILLDEPTTARDPQAEHAVYTQDGRTARDLEARTERSPSWSRTAPPPSRTGDLIVVLDGGRISESGPHADLAAGGRYAELFTLQAAPTGDLRAAVTRGGGRFGRF